MVATNLRLKPEFHQLHPSPWLPESRMWRAVLVAYGCLDAGHVVLGSALLGLVCLAVSAGVSPRMRGPGARPCPARLAECSDNGPFYRYTPGVTEQSSPIVLGLVILDGKRILIDSVL